jgi:hypothetical protein
MQISRFFTFGIGLFSFGCTLANASYECPIRGV